MAEHTSFNTRSKCFCLFLKAHATKTANMYATLPPPYCRFTNVPPSTSNCAPVYYHSSAIHPYQQPLPSPRHKLRQTHHISTQLTCKKHCWAREIRRLAQPSQRNPPLHVLPLILLAQVRFVQLCPNSTRQ